MKKAEDAARADAEKARAKLEDARAAGASVGARECFVARPGYLLVDCDYGFFARVADLLEGKP